MVSDSTPSMGGPMAKNAIQRLLDVVIFKQVHQHFCRGPLVRAQGPLIACMGPPWVHAQSPSIKVVATCRALECMRGAPRMHRRALVKTLRHGCFMQNFSTMSGCDVANWKNDGLFSCTVPKKECFYSLKCQISSKQHTVLRQCRLKIT